MKTNRDRVQDAEAFNLGHAHGLSDNTYGGQYRASGYDHPAYQAGYATGYTGHVHPAAGFPDFYGFPGPNDAIVANAARKSKRG